MWFTASSVTATNNSNVVKINSNDSIANVKPGDALIIGSFNPVEILKAYASDQGGFIQLTQPWANATQSQVPALVLPTRSALNVAITAINGANKLVNDNYQAILDWQTKTGEVTFKNLDNQEVTVKTAKQLELDVKAVQPYPWAIRKVEFEARRQQNLEKYAASGFVHKGLHNAHSDFINPVGSGLFTREHSLTTNSLFIGCSSSVATAQGDSAQSFSKTNIAGVLTELFTADSLLPDYGIQIKLPPAEDGTRTYDTATVISVRHATPALAFAAETATNKVVTDRVDMWGFESYLREISDSDPFVYANGLIQSRATSINGVTTTDDNVRPITYFAWYEGDDSSRGRGVNWQNATESQRIAIASDPKNNIYFNDATGNFEQWCVRGRSFAGLGNGDWLNINSATLSRSYPDYIFAYGEKVSSRVSVQGNQDSPVQGDPFYTATSDKGYNSKHPHKGVYSVGHTNGGHGDGFGIGGNCYFLVCGTLNRLNQGAYHPSFNPFGASKFTRLDGMTAELFWSNSIPNVTSKAQCFNFGSGYPVSGGSVTEPTVYVERGRIGGISGRPDGRYYDAIYASGAGGVCRDMRYSAHGLSLAELAEHDLKVKSGEYRGVEQLKRCTVHTVDTSNGTFLSEYATGFNFKENFLIGIGLPLQDGDNYYIINTSTNEVFNSKDNPLLSDAAAINHIYWPASWGLTPDIHVVLRTSIGVSVAGEYLHTDAFGSSVNLLQNDMLKNGWVGDYSIDLPDGSNDKKRLTRPVYSTENASCQYYNEADGWVSAGSAPNLSELTSTVNHSRIFADGNVVIVNYMAKAKMTRPSDNLKILGGYKGIGSVFCCSFYASTSGFEWGKGLAYSLSDVVMVSNNSAGNLYSFLLLNDVQLRPDKNSLEETPFRKTTHQPISIVGGAPINGIARKGLKALDYVTEINGQASICYAYSELHYDSAGGNWGDDSQVHIVDGQSTMPDLNGHTVKVGTAIIVEPLGWIRNAA